MNQRKLIKKNKIPRSRSMMILFALIAVYLFWGGTYLGMKFAIETIPPFLMAGARFSIAGWILYIFYRLKGEKRPTFKEWKNAGIVGGLLLLGGNGVVAWAEQQVPSSIASVLIATVPIWIIVINSVSYHKRPKAGAIIGIALGLCGIAILVWDSNGVSKSTNLFGMVAIVLASLSWSAGSMYSRTAKLPKAPLLSTGMQMIVGGILLLITAVFHGDYQGFELSKISINSWIAMGYLIVFGSLIGFTAYIWLLKNTEPSLVSTHAFVNPIVAVFLGWFLAGEKIGANALVAALIIIAAVASITIFREKSIPKDNPTSESNISHDFALEERAITIDK